VKYSVLITRQAQKELAEIPLIAYGQIKNCIFQLEDNPRPPDCVKLTTRKAYRIRIRKYRVIYEIDDAKKTVTILHIGHRRDIYK